jgi:hypothetical protein
MMTVLVILLPIATATPPALGDNFHSGLDYCAPPPAGPICVDTQETYMTAPKTFECQSELDRYVKMVVAYRVCVNNRVGQTILSTNALLERFKCKSHGGRNC